MKRTGAGVALTAPQDIARQLTEWYRRWQTDPSFQLERNEDEIGRYSRHTQAGQLADLLNQVSHSPAK